MSSKSITSLENSNFRRVFRERFAATSTKKKVVVARPHAAIAQGKKYFRAWIVIPTQFKTRNIKVSVGPHGRVVRVVGTKQKDTSLGQETEYNSFGTPKSLEKFRAVFQVQGKVDTKKLHESARAVLSKKGVLRIRLPKDQTFGGVKKVPIDASTEFPIDASGVDAFADMDRKKVGSEEGDNVTVNVEKENESGKDISMTEKVEMAKETKPVGRRMTRRLAVPGVLREDLNVEYDYAARKLRIVGIRRSGPGTSTKTDQSIEKTFRLRPVKRGIDLDKLSAKLDNGVVTVTAPKIGAVGKKSRSSDKNIGPKAEASQKYVIPVADKNGKDRKNNADETVKNEV